VVDVGVLTNIVVVVVDWPVELDSVVGVVDGSVDVDGGVVDVGTVGPVVVVVAGAEVGKGAPG
jgi:hypothetical protein